MTRRTPRIPVDRGNVSPRAAPRRYQHDVNPQPTVYDPKDQRFAPLFTLVRWDSDSDPDMEEIKKSTDAWEAEHREKMFPAHPRVPLPPTSPEL
ncbi:uncharacterized protein BDZ99DRAFT_462196 [Mytilinidion resinicola]|uniref:Uncharacterized protein n=1 Tax=Mytilinidion resinicola TaxID=574789 RepID=A0A6A6YPU6_9PEZI|nr:uncharacterized protein BDZ99DRAFT_462196 [Mytilinidion resinicola]KAF2810902.1 hypothetical protein BDZ99DRAFT_462196 [Mytilinidion resinicola]